MGRIVCNHDEGNGWDIMAISMPCRLASKDFMEDSCSNDGQ